MDTIHPLISEVSYKKDTFLLGFWCWKEGFLIWEDLYGWYLPLWTSQHVCIRGRHTHAWVREPFWSRLKPYYINCHGKMWWGRPSFNPGHEIWRSGCDIYCSMGEGLGYQCHTWGIWSPYIYAPWAPPYWRWIAKCKSRLHLSGHVTVGGNLCLGFPFSLPTMPAQSFACYTTGTWCGHIGSEYHLIISIFSLFK